MYITYPTDAQLNRHILEMTNDGYKLVTATQWRDVYTLFWLKPNEGMLD